MIFVRDAGWMCNNILQYGHVYAWGREHGRATMSLRFAHKFPFFRISHSFLHNFIVYSLVKLAAQMKWLPTVTYYIQEEHSPEKEAAIERSRHVIVEGWGIRFYDLFEKYKDEIVNLFAFDKRIEKHVAKKLSALSNDILLGVHIRRGNYDTFYGGRYFYDDTVYIEFIKAFAAQHPDNRVGVVICGNYDKIDKERFHNELPQCDLLFPNGNAAQDLCILSKCNHLIGPPSTFSLVAAMYHDIPLCWMHTPDANSINSPDAWGKFNYLFRHII